MEEDSLQQIITIPADAAALAVLDTDLDQALAARYSTDGVDLQALRIVVPPPKPTWREGIEGTVRHTNAGDNSGVLAIITLMFVLITLSYKHCRRLFTTLYKELLGMRQRANAFEEHTTSETRVLVLMGIQWSVYTALLLYSYISSATPLPVSRTLADTVTLIGLTGSYYLLQLAAYNVVGYTFSDREGHRYFVQGFTASQSLLGFLLVIPALVAIFYQAAASEMIILSATLYLSARIIFIIKGFRIFYHKISSLCYFILYLCTLEIIPLIVLFKIALSLVNSD